MKKVLGQEFGNGSCPQDVFCCMGFEIKEYIPIRQTKASDEKQSL